jgi:hypothetical protein
MNAGIEHDDRGKQAIPGHQPGEALHHRIHLHAWCALTLRCLNDLPDLVQDRLHERHQQLVTGAEVIVSSRLGEAELIGDHLQRGAGEAVSPDPTWAPPLSTYLPSGQPLPPVGTYTGPRGGAAVVSEAADSTQAGHTIRTVTYTDYVNEDGMILNGTESTNFTGSLLSIHYLADITVTGTHTGYLRADATVANRRSLTGYVTSDLDGDVESLLDPANLAAAQARI